MILLVEEILHQLIGIFFHYLQGYVYIPGGAGFPPSTVLLTASSGMASKTNLSDAQCHGRGRCAKLEGFRRVRVSEL